MRKNKILKIFIAIVLLISMQTAVIATTTGTINTDTVRIREKATTKSNIVGLISIGDKVTIIEEENGWYKVKCKDDHGENVEGYIRKDLLTVDKDAVIPNQDTNDTPTDGADTTTNNKPTPDNNTTSNDTSTQVENPNVTGTTAGQDGPIEENTNESGEVAGDGQNLGTSAQTGDKTISTLKAAEGVSVGKKVQLVQETKIKILPSANSTNIAKLNANTEVTVLEAINSWCRIEAGEYVGWVRIDQ